MSLVRIKEAASTKAEYALQVGTRRDGALDDPFWMVYFDGPEGRGYPYEDWEVERVPAHRGKYDPCHLDEVLPGWFVTRSRHRKEGEAN